MDRIINPKIVLGAERKGGTHRLYDIAVKHAETTMAHAFRPDYTSYHVAVYNPVTGDFIKGMTHQGLADNSMWARGQAWAIYGYTMVYRETHDPRFLDFAQKVTDVYLDRLPSDYVPYWDFSALMGSVDVGGTLRHHDPRLVGAIDVARAHGDRKSVVSG